MKNKVKIAGNLIWKWVLWLLLPPITLIIAIELAKATYQAGSALFGFLIILIGLIAEAIEILALINKSKEILEINN